MSIILNGLNMPTERESFNLTIKYNGTVLDTETGMQVAEAHELPPHGDLIDRDALMKGEGRYIISFGKEGIDVAEINRAPTIIEAEEGE